jgi:hypothetical protein
MILIDAECIRGASKCARKVVRLFGGILNEKEWISVERSGER